jgi:hypothetical protein
VLPALIVVGDAVRLTGMMVKVVEAAVELVVPELAVALNVVVLVGMPVSV